MPSTINPIIIQIYYQKLIEMHCSKKEADRIWYYAGKSQARLGSDLVDKKYGYSKSLKSKKKILELDIGQPEIVGMGKFDLMRADFKNNIFISRCRSSPYAEVYKMFFGLQKECVDFWLMGIWAGGIEPIVNEKLVCFETNCVAKGDKYCEFIIKPVKAWGKKDYLMKKYSYLLEEEPSLKDLGARFDAIRTAMRI